MNISIGYPWDQKHKGEKTLREIFHVRKYSYKAVASSPRQEKKKEKESGLESRLIKQMKNLKFPLHFMAYLFIQNSREDIFARRNIRGRYLP